MNAYPGVVVNITKMLLPNLEQYIRTSRILKGGECSLYSSSKSNWHISDKPTYSGLKSARKITTLQILNPTKLSHSICQLFSQLSQIFFRKDLKFSNE